MVITYIKSKTGNIIKIILLLLLPISIFIIPYSFIIHSHITICLYKNLIGHSCYGCGMTRALFSILHGKWMIAYHYNAFSFIVFALLLFLYIKLIIENL